MFYRIVNAADLERVKVVYEAIIDSPVADIYVKRIECLRKIFDVATENINVLDENYSKDRHWQKSLGGWLALFTETNEKDRKAQEVIRKQFYLSQEIAEVSEVVFSFYEDEITTIDWKLELYIVSCDYCIILIYPEENRLD